MRAGEWRLYECSPTYTLREFWFRHLHPRHRLQDSTPARKQGCGACVLMCHTSAMWSMLMCRTSNVEQRPGWGRGPWSCRPVHRARRNYCLSPVITRALSPLAAKSRRSTGGTFSPHGFQVRPEPKPGESLQPQDLSVALFALESLHTPHSLPLMLDQFAADRKGFIPPLPTCSTANAT